MALFLFPLPAHAQDLTIDLLPGITQQRNFEQKGRWQRQWVRTLPPKQDPYLMLVHGPEAWLDRAGQAQTPAQVAAGNASHLPVLIEALRRRSLLPDEDPLLTANRVVAVLRPVSAGTSTPGPAGRYGRLWHAWEVLADAAHVDTLSSAFTAVQTLRELGIPARLARYPVGGTGNPATAPDVFGVWLADDDAGGSSGRSSAADWTRRVDGGFLVPLARSVWPGKLEEPIPTWTWDEILADGWLSDEEESGGSQPQPSEPRTAAAPRPARDTPPSTPDVCAQARALGLECRPPRQEDVTLYVVSAVLLAFLGALGWNGWRARQQRLARQAERLRHRAGKEF